jgi:mannitol 2-dehydrogenase
MTMDPARPIRDVAAAASTQVAVPSYPRAALTAGIVHIGVGGFHRAHQAMFVDRLLAAGLGDGWAIHGLGLLEGDARMRDVLAEQGGLYTLVLRNPDGTEDARIIGSIVADTLVLDDPEGALELLADPGIRIVSLTITEGGYNVHAVTGEFLAEAPAIVADLAGDAAPATVFGVLTEALHRRRERGIVPFTVMSCDNMPGNGTVARRAIVSFARLRDPGLAAWIDAEVAFPNSMVDRITPVTTEADIAAVRERHGVIDGWPVVAEPFVQWVLEDRFSAGRPPFEQVGVQLVDDVEPYEEMKLRLLNASHQTLAYVAALADIVYVDEAMRDESIVGLIRNYLAEAVPTLAPVPGVDLGSYCDTLVERFGNPHVRDTVARLAANTSERIPKFLLPVARSVLDAGGSPVWSATVVASWARYVRGVSDTGRAIEVVDPERGALVAAASDPDPLAFLRLTQFFGDLADQPAFTEPYLAALRSRSSR